MTSKTIKTVLFASLTMALLASLSGMEFITAEKVTGSLAIPNAERDIKLAAGYKLYPGVGWVPPDQLRQIEPIYKENPSTGENVLDLDAMIERSEEIEETEHTETSGNMIQKFMNLFTIPLAEAGNGYNQIAHKDSSSNDFTYHRAYWDVPVAPADYQGGTNFSFPSIQPNSGSLIIFQPVLQHGYSSICDAEDDWVTYALIYVAGVGSWHTPCEDADDGDRIRGTISSSGNYWTIAMQNYDNSAANDSYNVHSSTTMTFGAVAVETYNLYNHCDELQGDLEFDFIRNTGDVDSWDDTDGVNQFCGQTENVVSDSHVEFFNNN